jgi:hypothetical protein
MDYGRRLYVRTSILNAKSKRPKIGLQVDVRAVDQDCMDPDLKSIGVGSMGVGIVALAVSNCVVFAVSRRFQDANPDSSTVLSSLPPARAPRPADDFAPVKSVTFEDLENQYKAQKLAREMEKVNQQIMTV